MKHNNPADLASNPLVNVSYAEFVAAAAPSTPAAGLGRVYLKSDKTLAVKDDAGLETVFGAGGGGGVPTTITVADTTDTTCYLGLFESATGDLAPKTDGGATYNASTGVITATGFAGPLTGNVTGNVSGSSGSTTGNAATATALATPRAINGVNFDGSAAITVTAAAGTLTGTTLAAGVTASSLTSFGSSPTLTTPTIASFTNATHTHLNAAGGGTLTAAAISDFDTQVRTNRLNEMAAPNDNLDLAGYTLMNTDVVVFSSGGLRTGETAADTAILYAYDVDGSAYVAFLTLTAANVPTCDLSTSVTIGGVAITSASNTQTLTNKTLTTPTISGAIAFPDNTRQTFNPGANAAGINVGSHAGDPDTPSNGDLWYDSSANELTARINGANVALGAGGGGISDGDKGDVVVSSSGTVWTLDSGVVTTAAKTVLDDTTVAAMVDTLGGASSTGTGGLVRATSPTLVTPLLGTPTSGTLTNCTGLPVAGGGTGVASTTAYAVLCGGTTSTAALQSIASVGTSGHVLTSNGAGALPTFQAAAGGSGKLVQRVSTESTSTFSTTTTIPLDNTIPQNTEGGELITLAITPTSTGNKLRVAVHCYTSASAIVTTAIALFRDSTADAIKASFLHTGAGAGYIHRIDVVFEVTPGSTSSETYKFRLGPTSAATVQANQASSTAYFSTSDVIMMEIMEIAP